MSTPKSPAPAAPAKKSKKWILLGLFGFLSIGSGLLVPRFLAGPDAAAVRAKEAADGKEHFVTFGEVSVNLSGGNLQRYLRLKIVLAVDGRYKQVVTEAMEHKKVALKSWLIGHLCDKTLPDVAGRVSVNRIRREILDHFNAMLESAGAGKCRDVLFEEFFVQ